MFPSKVKEQLIKHSQALSFNPNKIPSQMPKKSLNPSIESDVETSAPKRERNMSISSMYLGRARVWRD